MGNFGAALVVKENYPDIEATDNPFSFLDEMLGSEDEDEAENKDENIYEDDSNGELTFFDGLAASGDIILFKRKMVNHGKATAGDNAVALVKKFAAEGNEEAQKLLENVDI